jgi:GrpB-like predicted nucleotidyltransferase (UPF0157 family)
VSAGASGAATKFRVVGAGWLMTHFSEDYEKIGFTRLLRASPANKKIYDYLKSKAQGKK